MTTPDATDLTSITPGRARARFAEGLVQPTGGWCTGFEQNNMICVPSAWAYDVLLFAQRNPVAVPLREVTGPGDTEAPRSAPGGDLRRDVPGYVIWEHGVPVVEVTDATDHWRDDLVSFLYGCSFTFERALHEAGIELRHWTQQSAVPMFDTNIPCQPAGRLSGNLVVSMRPIAADRVGQASVLSGVLPHAHGHPVHVGFPGDLGISDLTRPDYGEPVTINEGELPVFWACGVTLQAVVRTARPPFAITHRPGYMLITDRPDH